MSSKTVKDIMRSPNLCLTAGLSLDQVSDHLTKFHLSGTPVIDENFKLIGFVSEFDCLQKLMQSSYYCDNTAIVSDVMSHKVVFTKPSLTLLDLASEMNQNKVNVMAVLENDVVIGVVSRGDVMRELVKELESCTISPH